MNDRDCTTCMFFRRRSDDESGVYGTCHRLPPVLSPKGDEAAEKFAFDDDGRFIERYDYSFVNWVQPAVTNGDWCGEYRSNNAEKVKA